MIITEYVIYRGKKIKVADLSPTSGYKVEVICPECKEKRTVHYRSVCKAGHTMCQSCSMKKKRGKDLVSGDKYGRLTVIKPSKKSGHSIFLCECGKVTEANNYNVKTGKTSSCGCIRSENMKKHGVNPIRENHWNWKGGVTGERYSAMSQKEYKDWRNSVFERDNYTCAKCGQIGCSLQAHHILNYASNPESRLDADNGITLCDKCHRDFHGINGHNTNKTQLDNFLRKD